jgi:hypothetical protein
MLASAKSLEPSNLTGGLMASNPDMSLEWWQFWRFADMARKPHLGTSQSRRPYDTIATVPTPPSQRAANHMSRCFSGRGFGSGGINDNHFRP